MTKHIQIEGYSSGGGGGGGDADTLQGHPASDFAPAVHIHDDRYYTETEIGNLLSGKSNTGHTHAQLHDRAHTMASASDHSDWPAGLDVTELGYVDGVTSGIQGQLNGKAASDHAHDIYAQLAGRAGGQTLYGGVAAGEDLTLYSTSHGTKGKIKFGTKHWYDEANDQWLFHNVLGDHYSRAYIKWEGNVFKFGTEADNLYSSRISLGASIVVLGPWTHQKYRGYPGYDEFLRFVPEIVLDDNNYGFITHCPVFTGDQDGGNYTGIFMSGDYNTTNTSRVRAIHLGGNNASAIETFQQLYINDPEGDGAITNFYGIYLDSLVKGSVNQYSIYGAGAGKWRLNDTLEVKQVSSVPAAGEDLVKVSAFDYAAGDTRLHIQSELGNPIILGKNELQFYNMYTDPLLAHNITAFADYSLFIGGTVKVTSASHGLPTGTFVLTIVGTTHYNGTYTAGYIDANSFYIVHSWDGDDATGTFTAIVYERAYMKWNANIFKIGTEAVGTGVLRPIQVDADIEFLKTVIFDEPFYDILPLPIGWVIDGTTPPGALATLSSTNKAKYRDFAGDADNDVFFEWEVPYGIDTAVDILFQVEGWITSATPPVNDDTVKFTLAGVSIGDSEILSSALGTAVTVTKTFGATHVQYDRFVTALSTAITITGLAAGEIVIFKFTRDTTDTYAQAIGVGWLKVKYGTNPQVS